MDEIYDTERDTLHGIDVANNAVMQRKLGQATAEMVQIQRAIGGTTGCSNKVLSSNRLSHVRGTNGRDG